MECPMEMRGSEDLLLDYASGRLAPAAAVVFERHLEHCGQCRKWADSQKAVSAALESWEAPPAAADFDRKLYRRIEQEDRRGWRLWPAFGFRPALSVALASALVLVAVLIQFPRPAMEVEIVDADRIERALDDVEMIRELSLVPAEAPQLRQM